MDTYKTFRRSVFVEGSGDVIAQRRIATEQQLNQNERMIAGLLDKNNISDFDSEKEGAQKRSEDLKASLNLTRAEISETEAALAKVEDQLRLTAQTIDLYRDDRASQRIAQAELELGQLLAKYLPNSDPVRQKRAELEQLRSVQSGYNGQASGGRRVGPNPVFQELATRRNTLQSTADSLREKEYTLQRQLNSADAKVRRLTQLYPEYQNLQRERDTLADRLNTYNAKEQEALINQKQSESNNENVREISRARYAVKGRNLRMLMFALAVLGWGFTLFMIAMARVFLDPRLYTSKSASARLRREEQPSSIAPGAQIPEPVTPYPAAVPYEYAASEDAQQRYDNGARYQSAATEAYPADPYQNTAYEHQAEAYAQTMPVQHTAPIPPNDPISQNGPVEWVPPAETYAAPAYPQSGVPQGYHPNGNFYAEPHPQQQDEGPQQPYGNNPYSS